MLQLTKRTEYGLIALVHIAERGGAVPGAEFVSVREICDRYPIPRRLVAEVLKALQKHAIVDSLRGATGGYSLARRPEQITLGQVVAALEGAPELTSCESPIVLKSGGCEVHSSCPIRSPVHRVREQLWGLLEHTTLRSLLPSQGSLGQGSLGRGSLGRGSNLPGQGLSSPGQHPNPSFAAPPAASTPTPIQRAL